ncbi:LytTR family DNA-binding domain-containing protein [Fusobacterium sp. IOR10]|uniref:LytR/AlgR family response regulator transcription factor n=1 Tax=Fusobacterium sp. IOR10 TaxID=2665157 RepID=UPI0013D754CC|nr:LytTR family DNA-binding domain-containing protein [Fusobacterium sp. IOR10]
MLNYIIVEDEMPAREELKYFLKKWEELSLKKEFDNPLEALKYFQNKNEVDVIFLDINMPSIDGVSLAKLLIKLKSDIKIIFITAYKEHAIDAFEIKAFDYILKPYSEERIDKVILDLLWEKKEKLGNNNFTVKKIAVHDGDKLKIIFLNEIYFIEVLDKECIIHTEEKSYVSKLKLSKFEEILPGDKFYRCHRSYIVNLNKIVEIDAWFNGSYYIKLEILDDKIPISRGNMKKLKEIFVIK